MRMAGYRNAHIHSSEVPFAGMQPKTWQKEFWKIVSLFLNEAGLTLADFLGPSEASATQHTMDEAAQEVAKSVSKRVRSHKDEFEKLEEKERAQKLREGKAKSLALEGDADVTYLCPSCGGTGLLEGFCVDEDSRNPHPNMDEWDAISYALVTRTYEPEQFKCFACGLKLNGLDELKIVRMEGEFVKETDEEYEWEPDYGND